MRSTGGHVRGSALVEFAIVVPILLFVVLGILQVALAFHAKSNLNYAVFEAARAGAVGHARPAAMFSAFSRSLVPFYGGGRNSLELAQRLDLVRADLATGAARLEILSPTARSFDDFNSPELSARAGGGVRVIPNTNIMMLRCPRDRPGCPADPSTNSSGQSLQDANLLAIRVTYGIPRSKQIPIVGRFYTQALTLAGVGRDDEFVAGLLEEGRIPIVARTTLRMLSEPFEQSRVILSSDSAGATDGTDPRIGSGSNSGGSSDGVLPGGLPGAGGPGPDDRCHVGDPRCDPNCGVRLCCLGSNFPT